MAIQVVQSCGAGWQESPSTLTGIFYGQAGDQIQLYAYMSAQVTGNGTYYCYPFTVPCLNPVTGSASAQFDAPFYVESLTPGVTYTSLGGANYSPSPEPSSFVLLATALAVVAGFARRTATSRALIPGNRSLTVAARNGGLRAAGGSSIGAEFLYSGAAKR